MVVATGSLQDVFLATTEFRMAKILRSLLDSIFRKFRIKSMARFDGLCIEVSADMPRGVRRALKRGDYELSERKIVSGILKVDDRVLEIGTGIGVVASVCSKLCTEGKLLCYEANPELVKAIRKNFSLNNVQAELVNHCIAAEDGVVDFYFGENFISSSAYDRGKNIVPVPIKADSFARVVHEFGPSVIVMDIEGAEVTTLHTADLSDVRAIVLEVHPWIVGENEIAAMYAKLAKMNFEKDDARSEKNSVLLMRKN